MKFDIRTTEKSDHEIETRLYINGIDVTKHIEKFSLSQDSTSPMKLSLTVLKNIDVSVNGLEIVNEKETDPRCYEYQYSSTERQPSEPRRKQLSRRLKEIIGRCF